MKKFYTLIYILSIGNWVFFSPGVEGMTHSGHSPVPAYKGVTLSQDTNKNDQYHLTLKDTRQNKPKIFQDPVKTYDNNQLLFFATFGTRFDYYPVEGPALEAEKIIDNFKVYPNPLYATTQKLKITYNIKKNALVTVKMLDVLGNEVSTLFSQEVKAGSRNGEFNIASNVSSGFYFIRLSADNDQVTKKLSVVQ